MGEILALRIYRPVVGILGILGNSLVCLVIWRVPAMQTRTNAFIFHQAVVDFLGSILIFLHSKISVPDPLPDDHALSLFFCYFWFSGVLMFFIFITSTSNLLAVTMERYFAIVHPFKYQRAFSRHPRLKVGLVIGVCWCLGASIVSCGFTFVEIQNNRCISSPKSKAAGISVVLLTYVAPVAVMLWAYQRTSAELKRGAARASLGSGQPAAMADSLLKARRNTLKTLLVVFITFMVCWTPLQSLVLIFKFAHDPLSFNDSYYVVSVALVATNSCVNPVIYAFKYRQFRKGLRDTFCGKKKRKSVSFIAAARHSTISSAI